MAIAFHNKEEKEEVACPACGGVKCKGESVVYERVGRNGCYQNSTVSRGYRCPTCKGKGKMTVEQAMVWTLSQ